MRKGCSASLFHIITLIRRNPQNKIHERRRILKNFSTKRLILNLTLHIRRGKTLTYSTRESLTYGTDQILTSFEAVEAAFSLSFQDFFL